MSSESEDSIDLTLQRSMEVAASRPGVPSPNVSRPALNASTPDQDYVVKRDGTKEVVDYQKVLLRLQRLQQRFNIKCHIGFIAQQTIARIYNGIETAKLDDVACEIAAPMANKNSEYYRLASVLAASNLHKMTSNYTEATRYMIKEGLIHDQEYVQLFERHHEALEAMIDYDRDFLYDYRAIQVLKSGDLVSHLGVIIERPQGVHMRQALKLGGDDLQAVRETYEMLSNLQYAHGTPTRMNLGLGNRNASCYLLDVDFSSVKTRYTTVMDVAQISDGAGGIGLNLHDCPAADTELCNGNKAHGVLPFLRVLNNTCVDAQLTKRRSTATVYLEPWHADIKEFVSAKLPGRKADLSAPHLFYACWMNDLFMERVARREKWSLFCPTDVPELSNSWGVKFEEHYLGYEAAGLARKQVSAVELWLEICNAILAYGGPFMLYKDACNRLSNQNHLGTLRSSNLCTEILQYTSPEEIAICNLAAVSLVKCVVVAAEGRYFDHDLLYRIVYRMTLNANRVIDCSHYNDDRSRRSNLRHRPLGLGYAGLADAFLKLRLPFDSREASQVNREISETMYYAFARASCDLARKAGRTYESYPGSLLSRGILNYHLHNVTPSGRWNFKQLEADGKDYGFYNSLGIALMPTSNVSQLLCVNESFEPYVGHLYVGRVISGDFLILNPHAEEILREANCWNEEVRLWIQEHDGSLKGCPIVPKKIQRLLKTVWEIKIKKLIDMSADRNVWVDQSQSFSLFFDSPDTSKISDALFYGHKKGLKTGMYYLRTKAPITAANMSGCADCVV